MMIQNFNESEGYDKGQIISKANYGVLNSPKDKTLKQFLEQKIIQCLSFERNEDPINCF